jgi:transposase
VPAYWVRSEQPQGRQPAPALLGGKGKSWPRPATIRLPACKHWRGARPAGAGSLRRAFRGGRVRPGASHGPASWKRSTPPTDPQLAWFQRFDRCHEVDRNKKASRQASRPRLRTRLSEHGTWPNSPARSYREEAVSCSPHLYRARRRVERLCNKIHPCRRVATAYDKLAPHDLAFVQLAL